MSFETISISNKLEVLPGGVINIPGCEPTSAITSTALLANRNCAASVITLAKAKLAIPSATVVMMRNPSRWYFVLPSGPPPQPGCDPCGNVSDWYQVLRDNATPISSSSTTAATSGCDSFGLDMFGAE